MEPAGWLEASGSRRCRECVAGSGVWLFVTASLWQTAVPHCASRGLSVQGSCKGARNQHGDGAPIGQTTSPERTHTSHCLDCAAAFAVGTLTWREEVTPMSTTWE